MRAFIHGTGAFTSGYVKYFIQRAHLQRLGNSSQPLFLPPPSVTRIFSFHFVFCSSTIIPKFNIALVLGSYYVGFHLRNKMKNENTGIIFNSK